MGTDEETTITVTEKHRAERHGGGGIWLTHRQVFWTVGLVAGFSWAMVFFMNLPNFVTTKEQGIAYAVAIADLKQDLGMLRTEQELKLNTMESKLVHEIRTQSTNITKTLADEQSKNDRVHEDLRSQIANVRLLIPKHSNN